MTELDAALSSLRSAFAVATVPDGGLLLHLPSGDFFPLDRVSATAWEAITQTDTAEAAGRATANSLKLSLMEAGTLLERIVGQAITVQGSKTPAALRFCDDEQAFSLHSGSRTLLSLDKSSLALTVAEHVALGPEADLVEMLRVFVPKLFGRWYPLALHASAVAIGGRTVLFCGESGAGKTTTARTVAEEVPGSRLFSEDVVLLADVEGQLMMVEGAETAIQSWMNDTTTALVEERRRSCDVGMMRRALAALSGRIAVHKAVFLGADRRRSKRWSLEASSAAPTMARLFLHSFFHSSDPAALRSHLHACRMLAVQIEAAVAHDIPAGLEALRSATRAQIETIAS